MTEFGKSYTDHTQARNKKPKTYAIITPSRDKTSLYLDSSSQPLSERGASAKENLKWQKRIQLMRQPNISGFASRECSEDFALGHLGDEV